MRSKFPTVDEILAFQTKDGLIDVGIDSAEESTWLFAQVFGAYVGEVVIRALGGTWGTEVLPQDGARPTLVVDELRAYPCEKVWKRLTQTTLDNVSGYVRMTRTVIANRKLPPK